MSGVATILVMSLLLGAASFGVGMLPLFFTFSKARLAALSTVGTGLLLGAALGIIIPEGIETLIEETKSTELPANRIALSLLCGFAFMLLVEQSVHGHGHGDGTASAPIALSENGNAENGVQKDGDARRRDSDEAFDMALREIEGNLNESVTEPLMAKREPEKEGSSRARAFPLTLGLVVHSLADGLALGASALPTSTQAVEAGSTASSASTPLSFVVFLALIIHKAPTALALSMSLLSTGLNRVSHRKHIAVFSAATPLGAVASFGILRLLGAGTESGWAGIALLVSGGTFLYVATVLQPVSHKDADSKSTPEMNEKLRAALIILGMFTPLAIGAVTGHGH